MASKALEIHQPQAVVQRPWESTQQIKARVTAIRELMRDVLVEGVDYGRIPGMPKDAKPCLLKPGSEKILAMFQLAVEPVVEDLSTEDCYRYRITCRILNAKTQEFLGAGVGECSSDETKYKWKRTYNVREFNNTPADRRRTKYSQRKDDHGAWTDVEEMQIRQEPADVANTVLKIAKKRSQVDGTLTVTAASSVFEQDLLEELDEDSQREVSQSRSRSRKSQPKQEETGGAMCAECRKRNGLHDETCKFHPKNKGKEQEQSTHEQKESTPSPQQKPEVGKLVCRIEAAEPRSKGDATSVKLTVRSDDHPEPYPLYCFHGSGRKDGIQADLLKSAGKIAAFEILAKKSGNNAWLNIEKVLSIGETEYVDNKPTASPSSQQIGFDEKEEEF